MALVPESETTRYGYREHSDNSQFQTNTTGSLIGAAIPLQGSTTLATSPQGGTVYSHANHHGDTITVTDDQGNRLWTGYSGPYGEVLSSPPPNSATPNTNLGWHGEQARITDRAIVHMGARPYSPLHGRFLAVDPIEGGCANDYVYVFGDPVNERDLNGMSSFWSRLGRFARCVSFEFIGIAPPGGVYHESDGLITDRPGAGPGSEGPELNLGAIAQHSVDGAARLAARVLGPARLARIVPGVSLVTNLAFLGKALIDCAPRHPDMILA